MIATEDNFFRLYCTHIEFVFNNNIDGKSHSEFLGSNNYINGKTNLLTKNNILLAILASIYTDSGSIGGICWCCIGIACRLL